MGKIKACIFDLDGVIVDTATFHYKAWKRLANELGFDLTPEQNEQLKGVSRVKSLDILLEIGQIKATEEEKKQLADKKNSWYREYIKAMNPEDILPGSIEFFEELKEAGIKIGVGSASKNARTILQQIKIEKYLDSIIDGNKVTNAKPNPEVFLQGAKEMEETPESCVVFEDAKAGIEAAKNGGMLSVGVGSEKNLGEADMVIAGLHEINLKKLLELENKA
ncbi:MAG: beta-phosphoglucomutase [Bacteroidales bacterium]